MNIRPFHSPGWPDETTLPLPLLGVEHAREFAQTQAFVHDVQPQPAEACTELLADPERAPFTFPLEPILTRHPWLGPVLVACVVIVWTCLDAYLESTP